ncbi:MAG: FAD-dependent monooxygenase [Acidobacteria bacterium]|nr:FAD-dependent monooxygenase [Acidobacteriota bacterium]
MRRHDVVIIGGSLAASSCARQLRLHGVDAVAFERDRFPRDKVCGSFLSPAAVQVLDQLGVRSEVEAAGAVLVRQARVRGFGADFRIRFDSPGLGISRRVLDHILAKRAGVEDQTSVAAVERQSQRFRVALQDREPVECRVVVDAAGKLSRFTKRLCVEEFGVHLEESAAPTDAIDFWFYEDAYGGTISVEGNRRNVCYLVRKRALRKWVSERDWRVTGPLAYERMPGPYISIGDAAGMVDPFCGDGMGHALASGVLAAEMVAEGLQRDWSYETMRQNYELEWARLWARKRAMAGAVRRVIQSRFVAPAAFRLTGRFPVLAEMFLRKVWS